MELGRAASEEIAQLLDHHRQARWFAARRFSAHHGGLGSVAGRPFPVQHGQQVAQGSQPGAESQLRRVYGTRAGSGHRRRNRRNCRCRGPPQIPSRLRAQVQVRHVGNEAGHPLDERASLRGSSAGGVWLVGEGIRREVHALEVCLRGFPSPRLVISITAGPAYSANLAVAPCVFFRREGEGHGPHRFHYRQCHPGLFH